MKKIKFELIHPKILVMKDKVQKRYQTNDLNILYNLPITAKNNSEDTSKIVKPP